MTIFGMTGTSRCIHDNLPGQCGVSPCKSTPSGLSARVHITGGGAVFHRSPDCAALRSGQRKALGRGQEIRAGRTMDVLDAMADGYSACIPCFPDYAPEGTKLCWVRVEGRWVKGLLTRWKKDDGRWEGWTSYVVDIRQETVLVPADDLRPRKVGGPPPSR